MKNSVLAIGLSIGFATTALAQVNVPTTVLNSFKKAYPNVKAKWEKEGLNYEAGFTKDGHETSVIYNPDGLATATEVEIAISALPKPVKDKLAQNYKGAKIKEAAKITKGNGAVEYEAEINGKDILFSAEGKALNNGKTAD